MVFDRDDDMSVMIRFLSFEKFDDSATGRESHLGLSACFSKISKCNSVDSNYFRKETVQINNTIIWERRKEEE